MNKLLISLFATVAVTACAHPGRLSTADRLALYQANAGTPVSGFQHSQNLRWSALSDEALAVWPRRSEGYLLELRGRCTGLSSAHSISISSMGGRVSTVGRVSSGFDSVRVIRPGGSAFQLPCRIHSIRPLDARALANDKQELLTAQTIEREAEAGEE